MNPPNEAIFTTYVTFKISIRKARQGYRDRHNIIVHRHKKSYFMYFLKIYKVCGRFGEYSDFFLNERSQTKNLDNKKFQDLLVTILLKEPTRSAAT